MVDQGALDSGLDVPWNGVALKRDFHGFVQSREGEHSPWAFYACDFDSIVTDEAGQYTVLRADGGRRCVSTDAGDRITIVGRKHGRKHWNH